MKKGFTLLELLIVIIILGILAAIAMPRYFANIEKAREAEARATLNSIREAELAYFATNGVFVDATTSGWSISVSLSGGTQPDIYLTEPQSASFAFTAVAGSAKYGEAITKTGGKNYYMCFNGGQFTAYVPTCP